MTTSSIGNICRVTGHLCGEFTSHRWSSHTKASDAELWCFLCSAWINGCVNNRESDYLKRHRAHHDVTVMKLIWYLLLHLQLAFQALKLKYSGINIYILFLYHVLLMPGIFALPGRLPSWCFLSVKGVFLSSVKINRSDPRYFLVNKLLRRMRFENNPFRPIQ